MGIQSADDQTIVTPVLLSHASKSVSGIGF
jgi:hypothetical protein